MSIIRKVKKIERLFLELEKSTAQVMNSTGLHCLSGCGHCCTKPDIFATPLEFLPYAWWIFRQGNSAKLLDKIEKNTSTLCVIFSIKEQTHSYKAGTCTHYAYRGLICRLFGYAVRRDKIGNYQLAACKVMKENLTAEVFKANEIVASGKQDFPVFSNFYSKLQNIDPEMGSQTYPINEAIYRAIQAIERHYTYRKLPKKFKIP